MKTPLLCVKELAAELGVSVETIRRAVKSNNIPWYRIGKLLRFDVEAVREAMRRRGEVHYRKARAAGAPGGDSRRRAQTRRPRAGNTGA
jgi:excisionase family DNA binding protein